MKLMFMFVFAALTTFGADTNTVKVFTTNYVVAASNFREVDGQLYDTTRSVKWGNIRCKFKKSFGNDAVFVKIERVKTGEYEAHETHNVGLGNVGAYSAPVRRVVWSDEDGDPFLVRNVPAAMLQVDKEYSPRLFLVGSTNEFQLYDFGTPHTNIVVTFKTIKTP